MVGVLLLAAFAFGWLLCGAIAVHRGRSVWLGLWLGCLPLFLGLVVLLCIPARPRRA